MRRRSAFAVQAGLCFALLVAASAALVPTRPSNVVADTTYGKKPLVPATPDAVLAPATAPAIPADWMGKFNYVQAASPEEAGKYIIKLGGCNDCHTPGFMEKGEHVPESEWLIGMPVGFNGPWGTTYPSNLRLFAKDFDEDTFAAVVRARNARPPMVWPTIHAMSDRDLRAVYRYIRSLPVKGEKMPEALPPGVEPKTPYIVMAPQFPPGTEPEAAPSTQPVAAAEIVTPQ